MALPTYTAGDTPEMLDSRDLIEWAEFNRDTIEDDDEDADDDDHATLAAIDALAEEGWEDWIYGAQFIREDYFEAFAQQFAEDCCDLPESGTSAWPLYCIDWEYAARELKHDYSATEYLGVTYYVR